MKIYVLSTRTNYNSVVIGVVSTKEEARRIVFDTNSEADSFEEFEMDILKE